MGESVRNDLIGVDSVDHECVTLSVRLSLQRELSRTAHAEGKAKGLNPAWNRFFAALRMTKL